MLDCKQIREYYTNLKPTQFAKKINIPYSTYFYYENGREPSVDVLVKISDYLGVSVDTLLGREKKEVSEDTSVKLGTDQKAIIKLAEKLDDAEASRVYNYILFTLDQKEKKTFENYDF